MRDIVGLKLLMKSRQAKDEGTSSPSRAELRPKSHRQLLLMLGIPFSALILYFYAIGRDRYFVRSEVVVRKANDSSPAMLSLGSFLGGGNQQSLEDARFLKTYLESPQVMEDLEKSFNFRKAYAKRLPDLYPGLSTQATREQVYDTFRRQITVSLNETSGQLTIRTLAFDPRTALSFNQFLIEQADNFVNKLNQDIYRKQLDFAQEQVTLNGERVQEASGKLLAFQNQNKLLDARSQGQGSEAFISALEGELAKKRVDLATLRRQFVDQRAPEIEAVQAQVHELKKQIQTERSQLVSPEGKNLSQKAVKQAELESSLNFASDLYKASISAAEQIRIESLQKQRFMAVLSKPLLPQEPWQYWRHKGFLTGVTVLLVGIALTKFVAGMADSHRN